jgi:hypothetical protein
VARDADVEGFADNAANVVGLEYAFLNIKHQGLFICWPQMLWLEGRTIHAYSYASHLIY